MKIEINQKTSRILEPCRVHRIWCLCLLLIALGCAESKQSAPTYKIGFSYCSGTQGDNWREVMLEGMQRELEFHPEVEFQVKDALDNSARQIEQIREFARQKVNLLIVTPNEALPLTSITEELFNKGISIIILDRRTASKLYTAYVGGDNLEIGRQAGHYVAELLHRKGNVLEIWGRQGSTPAIQRHQGFNEIISRFPAIRKVAEVDGQWKQHLVVERLPAVLKSHPEVNLIFAHNDAMGAGAYQVCQQLGIDHKIQIVGVDGLPGANAGIQYVEDGILTATMLYPTGGKEVIQLALRILNKEPYQKENLLGTMVIDSTDVLMLKRQSEKIASQEVEIHQQAGRILEQLKIYQNQQYALYILLAFLIITGVMGTVVFLSLRENKKINWQLQEQNKEIIVQRNQIMELSARERDNAEAKIRFFTNFSHELRTPLQLILGPLDDILTNKEAIQEPQRKDLEVMHKSTTQLLNLVNLLMDFRKIEVGKMPLRIAQHDLVDFIRDKMSVFNRVAQKRTIYYRFLPAEPSLPVWFDADLLDKVLTNLLANAFKFTPDRGTVAVSIQKDLMGKRVCVRIEDSGLGISIDEQQHIFDWFYQGQASTSSPGSGIGLALAKELVHLHQGTLSVNSEPGRGSVFELSLPLTQPVLPIVDAELSQVLAPRALSDGFITETPFQETTANISNEQESEVTLLLIENNSDVATFLRDKLRAHFQISTATDGTDGLHQALNMLPDLIICDVMMPGKNGLELVTQLKNDWRTSHIPVVILTARNTPDQQLEGVKAGADLYLTKPINPTYLIESVKALMRYRDRIRDQFRRELSLDTVTITPQRTDRAFVEKLAQLVEANLANPDLTVDDLADQIGMSRMQLYRKIKAQLGCSVTDYIQTVRLNKARELLVKPTTTVADVAYSVGFSSPTYFATAFKNKFNLTPSEFKNLHVTNLS